MFDTQAYKELFEAQEETKHPWSRGMTEDQVSTRRYIASSSDRSLILPQLVDRVFSKSYLTEQYLNGQDKVDFEKELRSIIQDKDKTWIDQEVSEACENGSLIRQKGIFEYKYNTDVVVCRKKT